MADPLMNIPGLAGFLRQRDRASTQEMDELRAVAAVTSLKGSLQKIEAEKVKGEQIRQAMAERQALGPNPTQEQLMGWATKYLSPQDVAKAQQHLQSEAATHSYRMGMLRTSEERTAEQARHNKAIEDLRSSGAHSNASPFYSPIYTPQGVMSFDARRGTAAPVSVDGRPLVRSADDPTLQGSLAGATAAGRATGQAQAERQFNMEGIGGIIQQADDILSGVRRQGGVVVPTDKPTGSGIGAAVDYAAGVFGMSPTGAAEAQQLKALGGALTAKMPRMQGPQSDRDVILYQQMAAEIGDSTVPIARRKAALITVKQLWLKYGGQNPGAFAGAPAAPGGGVPRVTSDAQYNALPSGATYIGPDGQLRRKK